MIKSIKVVNRFRMDLVAMEMYPFPKGPFAVVSIYSCPKEELMTPKVRQKFLDNGCVDVLSMLFEDGSLPKDTWITYPFTQDHAKDVKDFLDNLHARDEKIFLLLHCDAGISRSGAVATFAANYLDIDFKDDIIQPNPYVLRLLNEQIWREKWD